MVVCGAVNWYEHDRIYFHENLFFSLSNFQNWSSPSRIRVIFSMMNERMCQDAIFHSFQRSTSLSSHVFESNKFIVFFHFNFQHRQTDIEPWARDEKSFNLNENEHDLDGTFRDSLTLDISSSKSCMCDVEIVRSVWLGAFYRFFDQTHSCCGCHQRRLLIYIRSHFSLSPRSRLILTNDPQNLCHSK